MEKRRRLNTGDNDRYEEVMGSIRAHIETMPVYEGDDSDRTPAELFHEKYPDELVVEDDGYTHLVCHPEAWFKAKIQSIGIPQSMGHCTFDNYECTSREHSEIATDVAMWCHQLPHTPTYHNMLLTGRTGTGKTHLAVGCAKSLVQDKRSPRYFYWREMVEVLKDREMTGIYFMNDPIIIDDIGESSAPPYVLDRLQLILKHRLEHYKPTIITSNLVWPNDWLSQKLADDRLVSRFAEFCKIIIIDVEDYRIKNRGFNDHDDR